MIVQAPYVKCYCSFCDPHCLITKYTILILSQNLLKFGRFTFSIGYSPQSQKQRLIQLIRTWVKGNLHKFIKKNKKNVISYIKKETFDDNYKISPPWLIFLYNQSLPKETLVRGSCTSLEVVTQLLGQL